MLPTPTPSPSPSPSPAIHRQRTAARTELPPLPAAHAASRWAGAFIGLMVCGIWAALWLAALAASALLTKLLLAWLAGTAAGLLVILGHDAAHESLTPWRPVNRVLARLFFLPPWQTASGWQQAHREHHAYTNLKSHDDGYPPPSPAEWRAWSHGRRAFWRFKHSLPGLFLFYLDVWWRRVIWPARPDPNRRLAFRFDSLLVLAFAAAQIALAWQSGSWSAYTPWAAVAEMACVVVLPFIVCNWWVSAITLQQHRHPGVRWFDCMATWRAQHDRVADTVHLAWPQPAPWLLFNIFEHTAHHIDPQRPFTLLGPAQQRLAELHAQRVVVVHEAQPWRMAHLRRVLRDCQLHDYASGRWLRFDEAQRDQAN